jgi:hypothetical protein
MESETRRHKIFGVTVHGDFAAVVGLGSFVCGARWQGEGDFSDWALALAASIVVHQLGQLGALRALGARAPFELGLHTARSRTARLVPWQTILVSLAGPAACALVALLVVRATAGADSIPTIELARRFGAVGVAIAAVELAPMLPFDGGVAMRALLDGATAGRGEWAAQRMTIALGAGAMVAGVFVGSVELLVVGGWCAVMAARAVHRERFDRRAQAETVVLAAAEKAYEDDDLATTRRLVVELLERSTDVPVRARAAELGAWTELRAGDACAAKTLLESMPETLWPSDLLRATLRHVRGDEAARAALDEAFAKVPAVSRLVPALVAFGRGDEAAEIVTAGAIEPEWLRTSAAHLFRGRSYGASAVVSQRAFERTNLADHAYNAACALVQAKRLEEAVAWLTKAVEAGFADAEQARADADLEPLRANAAFAALLVSLARTHPYRS